jgi:hypothetical protein
MTGGLAAPVLRTVAHGSQQKYRAFHLSHLPGLPVIKQAVHTAEDARALAAHRAHLWHEWELFKTSVRVEGCLYLGPSSHFHEVPN